MIPPLVSRGLGLTPVMHTSTAVHPRHQLRTRYAVMRSNTAASSESLSRREAPTAKALVSRGVQASSRGRAQTSSQNAKCREPLCAPPFPQVASDRKGQRYAFNRRTGMRSSIGYRALHALLAYLRRRRTHLIELRCPEGSDSLREAARAIFLHPQAMLPVVETGRGLALAT